MVCSATISESFRQIDSARYYLNEEQVGKAVRESGLNREELFVSECRITRNSRCL